MGKTKIVVTAMVSAGYLVWCRCRKVCCETNGLESGSGCSGDSRAGCRFERKRIVGLVGGRQSCKMSQSRRPIAS